MPDPVYYYGPWQQPPDTTVTALDNPPAYVDSPIQEFASSQSTVTITDDEEIVVEGDAGHLASWWNDVEDTILGGETFGSGPATVGAAVTAQHINNWIPFPTSSAVDQHDTERRVWQVTRYVGLPALGPTTWGHLIPPTPSGAIGVEVEDPVISGFPRRVASVVGATVTATVTGEATGGHFNGLVLRLTANAMWGASAEILSGGDTVVHGDYPALTLSNALADVTGSGSPIAVGTGADGTQVVTFDVDLTGTPDYTGLMALWTAFGVETSGLTIESDDYPNATVSYQALVDWEVTYMIRPPRFRWVYEQVPYRRTYPRDDALAGGAARTWPPARSVQSSNRTFGGYL